MTEGSFVQTAPVRSPFRVETQPFLDQESVRLLIAERAQKRREFVQFIDQSLWESFAVPHEIERADTHERIRLAPPPETAAYLRALFEDWTQDLYEEMWEQIYQPPYDAQGWDNRYQDVVTRAFNQPIPHAAAARSLEGAGATFDQRLTQAILALRAFLGQHRQAFSYADQWMLRGRSIDQQKQAWSEAIDENRLLLLNRCFGMSRFPLELHGYELEARGLMVEHGVCHPVDASLLEKQVDERTFQQGRTTREQHEIAVYEAKKTIDRVMIARSALQELFREVGDLPDIDDWAVHVANHARRHTDIEIRGIHIEREHPETDGQSRRPEAARSLSGLAEEKANGAKLLDAYRRVGAILKVLDRANVYPFQPNTSLSQMIQEVTQRLQYGRWSATGLAV